MYELIKAALKPYSIGNKSLIVEKELHTDSWNNDLHFKVVADGKPFSARFIKNNRSPNNVFGEISNEVLGEQVKFCDFLLNHDIPFMRLFPTSEDVPFTLIKWGNENFRFILFEWIDGQHITHCNEGIAEEFGKMARRFHNVSSTYKSSLLPKTSHLDGYYRFIETLRSKVKTPSKLKLVEVYVEEAEYHIKKATPKQYDFIIQSDLNPLNVLWDDNKKVIGIVDFESIGYGDRIEGLAWLIKWYSRTNGIHSTEMSSIVANAFLKGYKAENFLDKNEFDRLRSLIWLSGCINWNFIRQTSEILVSNEDKLLEKHLDSYKQRGKKLLSLIPKS